METRGSVFGLTGVAGPAVSGLGGGVVVGGVADGGVVDGGVATGALGAGAAGAGLACDLVHSGTRLSTWADGVIRQSSTASASRS